MSRLNYLECSNSTLRSVLFVFVYLLIISCSSNTRSLFFDIPPEKPKSKVEKETAADSPQVDRLGLSSDTDLSTERPAIETVDSWDEALSMLPKDYKKQADWSAAVEQGVVKPRYGIDPKSSYDRIFQYDFIIEELPDKPKNEGYFPHSSHTQWLGCKNCHMTLYPYKRNFATMKEMRQGLSCGACHGKVAFSLRQCKRCHLER